MSATALAELGITDTPATTGPSNSELDAMILEEGLLDEKDDKLKNEIDHYGRLKSLERQLEFYAIQEGTTSKIHAHTQKQFNFMFVIVLILYFHANSIHC